MPHFEVDYKPQDHQLKLHECNSSLVCVTGRQIGKTVCAVNELIKRALTNDNTRNWYITNDYRQAKRNVWDLFKKYIPKEVGAKFNSSELLITIPNGSRIELIGVENLESLRGAAVHFAILDEYADFPGEAYSKVIRPMFATTGGQVWFIGTPKGLGNDLYTKYTEDSGLVKFKFPACRVFGSKVVDLLSEYTVLSELQEAYDKEDESTFRQEYLGDFTRPSGTVYSKWDIDNFVDLEYSEKLPLHITFDFGVNDPTSIIWIQPNGSETRVIDYYEASNADIHHFIQVLNSKPYKTPDFCTGDIAGRARELSTGKSPIDILRKNDYFLRTSNIPNIQAQIRQTHQKIKGLYISKQNAERFRDCILNYKYPDKKANLVNQKNEVPIHDEYSHAMRAFEYWAWNTNPQFDRIKKETKTNSGAELMQMVELNRRLRG